MMRHTFVLVLGALLLPTLLGASVREGPSRTAPPPRAPVRAARLPSPLPWHGRFEENRGQAPSWARYLVRVPGYAAALTDTGAAFSLPGASLRMDVEGASPEGRFETGAPLPGRTHHLKGRDRGSWVRGAPSFGRVVRKGIRPGVDLAWTFRGDAPEYGFVLAPGADAGALVLRFEGADSLRVERDGSLAVGTAAGVLRHGRPAAWQERDGVRTPVPVAFEARGPARAGFRVGPHDPARSLVIDPLVSFASYFGGEGAVSITALVPSPDGTLLVAGYTSSFGLAPFSPLDDSVAKRDAFLAKLGPAGDSLLYATYIGGSEDDSPGNVAVDAAGCTWVVGASYSEDFPVFAARQGTRAGVPDGFVLRLNPAGDAFVFSSYLGGMTRLNGDLAFTIARRVALVPGGGAVVVGLTGASDFPLLDPFQPEYGGAESDGFVAGFSDEGVLTHSSFLGGANSEVMADLAVDADGAAHVVGYTTSVDFPEVGGVPGIRGAGVTAFLAKVAPGGGSLERCQLFGGNSNDRAESVTILPTGDVAVGGVTDSSDFPLVNALPEGDTGYGFLCRFSAAGDVLQQSSRLGIVPEGLCAASDGSIYAAGSSNGYPFTLVSPIQATLSGSKDAFLLKVVPDGSTYSFTTYLGGNGYEEDIVLALEDADHVWLAGRTDSEDYPVVPNAPAILAGNGPGTSFLIRVSGSPGPPSHLTARPLSGNRTTLRWLDESNDEGAFEIQRKFGTGSFVLAATLPGNRVTHEDFILAPTTTYTYRVRAIRPGGPTEWSAEAQATTLDVAPLAPAAVLVSPTSRSSVRVSWTPGSPNADVFELYRRVPGGVPFLRTILPAGTVEYEDVGLPPASTTGYVVRALNEIGSAESTEAWGSTDGTVALAVTKGSLKSSADPGKDSLRIAGTLAMEGDSPDGTLDPIADGVSVRIGGAVAPLFLLEIPPASPGWKAGKGKLVWKTSPLFAVKVRLELNSARGTFRLAASRLDFTSAPSAAVECRIGCGNDAGVVTGTWEEKTPGSGKYRFPPREP